MQEVRKEVRYGTGVCDWQARIDPERMRRERLAKTQAAMKENGIAALLLNTTENKRYATSIRGAPGNPTGGFAVVFADSPDSIVYEEGPTWLPEREHIPWIKTENYRPINPVWLQAEGRAFMEAHIKEISGQVKEDLRQRKLEKEKLGADFLSPLQRAIFQDLGVKVVDTSDMMMECRIVKTEDEIECMKMAGAIVDIAFAEIIEKLRPGMRENEISAIGHAALVKNGAETVVGVTVRSGPNTAPNYMGRMPTDRIIQPGDMVFTDVIAVGFMGYRTCYYRSFKVGSKPTQQEKDWFKKCREYLYNGVDALRDGVSSADVAAKWPKATEFGYEHEGVASGNAMGHGIGLAQYEYPVITRYNSFKFPQPVKKNMTIAMETWAGQNDPAHGWRGGVRLESVWRVTEKGSENLYAMPDDELICPPHAIYT